MSLIDRRFTLAKAGGALGLTCTPAGMSLAGVPLLRSGPDGFVCRPPDELGALLKAAYGRAADPAALAGGLAVAARTLNAGDLGRAMVAAVRLGLPDLSWDGAVRIALADNGLAKYSADQPRDDHGRWTAGDGSEAAAEGGSSAHADTDSPTLGVPALRQARFWADNPPTGGAPTANSATSGGERPPAGPDPLVVALAGAHPDRNPFGVIVDPRTGALSARSLAGAVGGDPPPPTVPASAAQRQQYLEWLVGAKQNYPAGVMSPEETAARASLDWQSRLLDSPAARLARYPHDWDRLVDKAVADYNRSRGLAPGDPRYLDPKVIKAMIMVETAYDRRAYNSDPMQVNKPGDWNKDKRGLGLSPGVPPGPELGIRAGVAWLDKKAYARDSQGRQILFRGWDAAVRAYNSRSKTKGDPGYPTKYKVAFQLLSDADN